MILIVIVNIDIILLEKDIIFIVFNLGIVYWTDVTGKTVKRAYLTGYDGSFVSSLAQDLQIADQHRPMAIAVDWIGR